MMADSEESRPRGLDRQVAMWGTAAVAAHTLLTTLHTIAHVQLDVYLSLWQSAYVTVVIIFAGTALAGTLVTALTPPLIPDRVAFYFDNAPAPTLAQIEPTIKM